MKLDVVAGSKNDEFYTPIYAIEPLVKYLQAKNYKNIWSPFDTENSNFYKYLTSLGFNVKATHLATGDDFFFSDYECDCIVSNPPYSLKTEVFDRLFALNKPFAMLVGVVGIFESEKRFSMFANNSFEIMYLNKRISYFKDYNDPKPSLNPPFSSVYIAKDLFSSQIVFERVKKWQK